MRRLEGMGALWYHIVYRPMHTSTRPLPVHGAPYTFFEVPILLMRYADVKPVIGVFYVLLASQTALCAQLWAEGLRLLYKRHQLPHQHNPLHCGPPPSQHGCTPLQLGLLRLQYAAAWELLKLVRERLNQPPKKQQAMGDAAAEAGAQEEAAAKGAAAGEGEQRAVGGRRLPDWLQWLLLVDKVSFFTVLRCATHPYRRLSA